MLFDEKDFNVFYNDDSRTYFKEILQCYYSQNYRASIVLLYSFVIYDLFIKLQVMASEGSEKATNKLNEINQMIDDDEKYSKVENEIILFFNENTPLYFKRFVEDIEYLKNCRNKCAHLKVDDNSLYVPTDYQTRMLICSMYDNIFSVKAPFITDLFSFAKADVEQYSSRLPYITNYEPREDIINSITKKYLTRLTYDSLVKSYTTFIKLLFVSEEEECEENLTGLFVFAYSMSKYAINKGYSQFFYEDIVVNIFNRIDLDLLKANSTRLDALVYLMTNFSQILDKIKENTEIFEYVTSQVLSEPYNLHLYRTFFPREEKSIYDFFKEHTILHKPNFTRDLYETLIDSENFSLDEYMIIMVKAIPTYNGFHSADMYMNTFIKLLPELSVQTIKKILNIYKGNKQCTDRKQHEEDYEKIRTFVEENQLDLSLT